MRQKVYYKKGDVIGTCTFIEELPTVVVGKCKSIKRNILFECSCGKQFKSLLLPIKHGRTKSCGCLNKNKIREIGFKNKTHGQRKHPLYKMWQGMIRRCNNPKDENYHNYGLRGIKVCERWKNIKNFIDDMYPTYTKGMDIDRINNDGEYSIENCRWVTRKENMNNMRRNRIIEYQGVNRTVSEWSDFSGIPYKTLIARLNNWSVEKSFTYKNS